MVAFLAKHGYVHRDISEGNIYIHEGRGIVADFEFAKIIGDGGLNDLRRVSEVTMRIFLQIY